MNVKILYNEYVKAGYTPKDAAKMAQEKTGLSAVTGRPIQNKLRFTSKMVYRGQYGLPMKGA